jgi:methylated-DNA-protein-cysteine methyltransferase-like protein
MYFIEDATPAEKYKAILGVVKRVPKSRVATYSQIAEIAGLPGRARMVGKALGTAFASSDVPWFRVLRADGRIAFGADTHMGKEQAMHLGNEAVEVNNMRVNLKLYQWCPESLWGQSTD